uniref:Hydroxyproline-rich glycoprotein n=1 Tax=Populus alba TaxID=43335 RepID=A0A4U5NMB3_POPAL|nr:hydroxyproline-rich glycoprotein [Populus alba]
MASESQQHNKGESQPSESTLFPSGRLKSPGAGYTPPLSYPPTLGYAPPGPYPAYQPPGCYPYARAPPPAYYINATDVGVAHSSSHGSKNCEPPPFATSKDAAGVELEHALIKFTSVTW